MLITLHGMDGQIAACGNLAARRHENEVLFETEDESIYTHWSARVRVAEQVDMIFIFSFGAICMSTPELNSCMRFRPFTPLATGCPAPWNMPRDVC